MAAHGTAMARSAAVSLHHLRTGSGPPLLLAHGIGMTHRAWDAVVARLHDRFECFAVDLPGHGASARLPEPATVPALARACATLMRHSGHERFLVAGNSLGGGIALWLALEGIARSATALSPIGFVEGWERPYLHASLLTTRAAGVPMRHLAPRVARAPAARRALLAQMAARGDRVTTETLTRTFADIVDAHGFEDARRHALGWRCPAADGALPAPVTVAWGDHDRLLLFAPQSARARERLPQAQHLRLSGCGHLPGFDDPALVADVVAAGVAA
jgi:pimeloyl-ACP methyl ester carboxylesterase